MKIDTLFPTRLYRGSLIGARRLKPELMKACLAIAREDIAGQRWCDEHGYLGYTSYASLDDLPSRANVFAELVRHLDTHARAFAQALEWDMQAKTLVLDSLWINVMAQGSVRTGHIHPHSAISGTYYVAVPHGASAIRFEDPRLAMMMAAPARRPAVRRENLSFVTIEPMPGAILMWESWLRHEVPANRARGHRVSLSFNYTVR